MISHRALILTLGAALVVPAMAAAQADPAATARSSTPGSGPIDSVTAPVAPDSGAAATRSSGVTTDIAPMTPGQVQALRSGDNAVVTNGPVPDTPDNRAKYGGPNSNGGRKTPPAGN